jgi:hypothetical protein
MVDAVQSHWASLATAVATFGADLFGAAAVAFEPVVLAVTLAVAVLLFLPMVFGVCFEASKAWAQ